MPPLEGRQVPQSKSILETLQDKLAEAVNKFFTASDISLKSNFSGRVDGLALAIAIMTNPYNPKPMVVREAAEQEWLNERSSQPLIAPVAPEINQDWVV